MLANINKLTEERAQQSITKLDRTIACRTFVAYANEHAARIGQKRYDQAILRSKAATASADDFRDELEWLTQEVKSQKQAA